MENASFLGKGMKFPPQVSPATGRFETVSDKQSIKESVYLILMTRKTERLARPSFGASITRYTFADTDVTSLNIMARELKSEISKCEPRIENVEVELDSTSKNGCIIVNVGYTVISENARDNLVFPFYLDTTWEEEERDDDYEPEEI